MKMRKWQSIAAVVLLARCAQAQVDAKVASKTLLANLDNLANNIDKQNGVLEVSNLQLLEQKRAFSNFAKETANKLANDIDSLATSIEVSQLELGAERAARRNFKEYAKAASDRLARDIDGSLGVSHIEIEDKAKVAEIAREASTKITEKMAEWAEKYKGDVTKLREMLSSLAENGSKLFAEQLDEVLPAATTTTTAAPRFHRKKRLGEKAKSATLSLADELDKVAAAVAEGDDQQQDNDSPPHAQTLPLTVDKVKVATFLETDDGRLTYYQRLPQTLKKAQDEKLAALAADIAEIHDRLITEFRNSNPQEAIPVSALQFSWTSMFAQLGSMATQKISDYVTEFAAEAEAEHEKNPDSGGFKAAVSGFTASAFQLFAEKMSEFAEEYTD